jgi:hypothetical protein
MDHKGINAKAHATSRIEKAEKALNRLTLLGARFKNFHCRINLQFYATFIRPGLEYGLPLLVDESTALKHLQQCQKRIICKFLGINIIARNDIVEGISNCPAIPARQLMLRNRRAFKLSILWNSPHAEDHALVFVRRGLFGPTLLIAADLDISKTPMEFRQEHYVIPVSHSLAERSDGLVTIALLRWLLRSRISSGVFRTILLWLLHRWKIFDPPRRCLYCNSNFEEQSHVSSCSSLREALITSCSISPEVLDLNSVTDSPRLVVEHALLLACQNLIYLPAQTSRFLESMVDVLRSSLLLIFGAAPGY